MRSWQSGRVEIEPRNYCIMQFMATLLPTALRRPLSLASSRRRVWEALRASSGGLLVLALVVGAGSAGFAVVFRWLITTFTHLATGRVDYAATPGAVHPALPGLGRWFLLAVPVAAGLLYGPLVHFFAREARGHGVPEVMYAVGHRGARIAPQVAGVKALASALCIGGGGSVGREGPIVQIGSALGSTIGRLVRVTEPRLRVLVACGAAGGIAATFNAPLAGVFFAMELILADFTAQAFGMVVVAAVTSAAIGRAVLGDVPFLRLPPFTVDHVGQYGLYAVLGLIAGAVGVLFTRVLYLIEDACDWAWRGPEWLRPAVGGILLGLLLIAVPQMYGVGYPVLGNAIFGAYGVAFLLLLTVAKMVATSLTIGIGGSGGVFAPSLFIGAMVGSGFGQIAHHVMPGVAGPAGAYGLIGMGAVFAGAARAPITAVIILFELTGEYSIILPLMAAIVLATGVSHVLSADTIYTLKLRRRGVDLGRRETIGRAAGISVGDVMSGIPAGVRDDLALREVAAVLARSSAGVLPVLGPDNEYVGIVTARVVAEALAAGRHDADPASLVLELPVKVRSDDHLDQAIDALDRSGCAAVPVFDACSVVGWITYRAALRALHGKTVRPEAAY
ncbi:chloride channel protein [Kribbella sp. NBC_00889]|uniref:chloride channel protein n=1 Tax=Kribbella sp. NBC_00889 TaxID=2975974 RepID=UPI0038638BD3|nr:chloride channel protein [Kribbella sp. NBC_00889]